LVLSIELHFSLPSQKQITRFSHKVNYFLLDLQKTAGEDPPVVHPFTSSSLALNVLGTRLHTVAKEDFRVGKRSIWSVNLSVNYSKGSHPFPQSAIHHSRLKVKMNLDSSATRAPICYKIPRTFKNKS